MVNHVYSSHINSSQFISYIFLVLVMFHSGLSAGDAKLARLPRAFIPSTCSTKLSDSELNALDPDAREARWRYIKLAAGVGVALVGIVAMYRVLDGRADASKVAAKLQEMQQELVQQQQAQVRLQQDLNTLNAKDHDQQLVLVNTQQQANQSQQQIGILNQKLQAAQAAQLNAEQATAAAKEAKANAEKQLAAANTEIAGLKTTVAVVQLPGLSRSVLKVDKGLRTTGNRVLWLVDAACSSHPIVFADSVLRTSGMVTVKAVDVGIRACEAGCQRLPAIPIEGQNLKRVKFLGYCLTVVAGAASYILY